MRAAWWDSKSRRRLKVGSNPPRILMISIVSQNISNIPINTDFIFQYSKLKFSKAAQYLIALNYKNPTDNLLNLLRNPEPVTLEFLYFDIIIDSEPEIAECLKEYKTLPSVHYSDRVLVCCNLRKLYEEIIYGLKYKKKPYIKFICNLHIYLENEGLGSIFHGFNKVTIEKGIYYLEKQ